MKYLYVVSNHQGHSLAIFETKELAIQSLIETHCTLNAKLEKFESELTKQIQCEFFWNVGGVFKYALFFIEPVLYYNHVEHL